MSIRLTSAKDLQGGSNLAVLSGQFCRFLLLLLLLLFSLGICSSSHTDVVIYTAFLFIICLK